MYTKQKMFQVPAYVRCFMFLAFFSVICNLYLVQSSDVKEVEEGRYDAIRYWNERGVYSTHQTDKDQSGHIMSTDEDYNGQISTDEDQEGYIVSVSEDFAWKMLSDVTFSGNVLTDRYHARRYTLDDDNDKQIIKRHVSVDKTYDKLNSVDRKRPRRPHADLDVGKRRLRRATVYSKKRLMLDHDPTCHNRCGQKRLTPCSCDVTCFVYKTCCENVTSECPSLRDEARVIIGADLMDIRDLATCDTTSRVFMVTKCVWPEATTSFQTHDFITKAHATAIVYDNATGLVFKNRSVYNCYKNNSDSLHAWGVAIKINKAFFKGVNMRNSTNLLRTINFGNHELAFYPQLPAVEGHNCAGVIDSCKVEFAHLDPDGLCGKFISHYTVARAVYGNKYCYDCNLNGTLRGSHGVFGEWFDRTFSMMLLMDVVKSENGLIVNLDAINTGIPYSWSKVTCNLQNASIPTDLNESIADEGNAVTCNTIKCYSTEVIINGKCVGQAGTRLLLRHPPSKPFNFFQLTDLANFVSCFLEKDFKVLMLKAVVQPSLHFYSDSLVEYADVYNVTNKAEFFVIDLTFVVIYVPPPARHIFVKKTTLARNYWLKRGGFVEGKESGLLYFVDGHEQTRNQANEIDDEDEDDELPAIDNQRRIVMGLVDATSYEGKGTFPSEQISTNPIRWSEGEADDYKKQLDGCYDNGVDNDVASRESGVNACTSDTLLVTVTFIVIWVVGRGILD